MITKYKIPDQFGDLEIIPTSIIMDGDAGAPIKNDISTGGFFVDLVLIVGTDPEPMVRKGVRVCSANSQPSDFSVKEIVKAWAIAQLDAQYGVI